MLTRPIRRAAVPLWLGLLLLLPPTGPAAAPSRPEPANPASLAGRFLVAQPKMVDPNFAGTVVLMVRHGPEGAFGLIVNRPLKTVKRLDLFPQGDVPEGPDLALNFGGPVAINRALVIHDKDLGLSETLKAMDGLFVSPIRLVLKAMEDGKDPGRQLVVIGHSGWASRQLEGEMALGAWIIAEGDVDLVFDTVGAREKWKKALQREGMDL